MAKHMELAVDTLCCHAMGLFLPINIPTIKSTLANTNADTPALSDMMSSHLHAIKITNSILSNSYYW